MLGEHCPGSIWRHADVDLSGLGGCPAGCFSEGDRPPLGLPVVPPFRPSKEARIFIPAGCNVDIQIMCFTVAPLVEYFSTVVAAVTLSLVILIVWSLVMFFLLKMERVVLVSPVVL
ncbi:unnamed protein product [Prorocentrum cordatum]|uniref:Uncharacterized protein n=1 Tax=Prorocentrum cordatum TaxID=2364126 RepID=A0ABN9WUR5_9DINO|nr:unnamed protein product [Polarella glacialis]